MELSYILNHLAEERDQYFGAIAPPIIQTSNFAVKTIDELRNLFADESSGYLYSRGMNPTVDILRKKLAALDEAEDCLVFNSGAAAIFCSVIPFIQNGDHIISVKNPYSWAQKCFDLFLPKFGVHTSYVDGKNVENFQNAIRENTKIIYLESPNSWDYAIQDLSLLAQLARSKNIMTICDNSYCSPIYQKPIAMGIDISIQSATKYIGGHSDTVAGVLCGSHEHIRRIFQLEYLLAGNGIQAFNAWLLLRGLRTLPARLDRLQNSMNKVMDGLRNHPAIDRMIFPFDATFPQYSLAKKQMSGACGLMTLVLKERRQKKIEQFCERLETFLIAVSWGGHESLVIPRCAGIQPDDFNPDDESHRMVRFYIGLEEPDYLLKDMLRGLDQLDQRQ
ncbi:MAG: aminotransferase class V-fold PLP-dependent enzyme [Saprospiraceae bacterium]|jgi:cystathionine beta-lyase/cystathionine gamma-synthase|nr:aminotransferase class V-fold PLP-dependent enzyme [Saprospiraceae bacterium]MBK7797161.1 aminotransferase class V-fold PLP-dependent enzyme [Saprospiraceae bacterium]MBL0261757.1 aminotransferase class V-fold PLP-dependent enzyme [Saprospiraceae bacterium]MBX7163405.1 PLP-dependent transferase [Saprospiraceae bacterium]